MNDLRYAARMIARTPGFTVVAAGLLAAGIGANAVIFSALDAVMLRPLPVRHPEELVRMVQKTPQLGTRSSFDYAFYKALRDHSTTLSSVFGEQEWWVAMNEPRPAEQLRAGLVTPEFFDVLGVPALYGRALTTDDAKENPGDLPAVLSYGFWQRRFEGDPRAVGHTITLREHKFVIVGIMPREFNGTSLDSAPDVRVPLRAITLFSGRDSEMNRTLTIEDLPDLDIAGRLKPGVTREQAQAESLPLWRASTEALYKSRPDYSSRDLETMLSRGLLIDPLEHGVSILRDKFGSALKLLIASVGLLLLMVCANVAGLLLARSAGRREEIAVRLAIGATRGRLVRQMLVESCLLTTIGAVGGMLLAWLATPLLVRALPPMRDLATSRVALSIRISPDRRVLLFSLLISAATVLLCGLAPAISASRAGLDSVLRSVRSVGGWRGRQALIVIQIGLCTLLLAGAALLARTLEQLESVNPGFDRDHLVTFSTDPSLAGYTGAQATSLRRALMDRVKELPGVVNVAIASRPLMRGSGIKATIALAGQRTGPGDFLNTSLNAVTPEYFDTMGMRMIEGRVFTYDELNATQPPRRVVVNEAFVRRFLPGVPALGQHFGPGGTGPAPASFEIIGVASDAKYRSLREPMTPTYYAPFFDNNGAQPVQLIVRTHGRPDAIIEPVRRALAALDPAMPFTEIETMTEEVAASTAGEKLTATLASLFGALAAVLAAIGIYGLLAFAVAQRRREIGIRMALGARPADIGEMIGKQSLAMVVLGIVLGLAGAFAISPLIRSLLYGVAPADPVSLAASCGFVAMVAAIATAVPVMHASRVEPASALRED